MAQAARKRGERASARRTQLRIVKTPRPARKPRPARRASRAESHSRSLFLSGVILMAGLTVVGLVRVAVIARAAEMTISANDLIGRIAAQRVEAGRLEVDRSSLSTPSRLESIASITLGMRRAKSVRYLEVPEAPAGGQPAAADAAVAPSQPATEQARPGGLLGALMDMSAGEAQALLLGDMGLAGAR